ncbi:NAD(P)-binding protein [Lindgomyces ingoldianus]|uniref:NAD(P)-binding protein n=1 Tax=Lindgomyces ingoldianus TaxID=673940 RepID=A0ACB6RE90_9PLEO|nr:NAD(P)-binding protein [Lindgomyces ingoldianus]KAF2476832.1 NAD(P)-binding protein [Lindgomyces ingoldianus]
MATPKSILILGAGLVGRHVIDLLLAAGFSVTTLVRNAKLAATLEKAGAKPILGTLEDVDLITAQTTQHEVIINTSSSDDLPSAKAILAGVRQRVLQSLPVTLIHTSGTGLLVDDAKGRYKSEKIYRDDDPTDIDALPPTALHRNVDLATVQAARELGGKARVVILIPPVIYGFNPAHQRLSMALPKLVRFALKHGYAGRVQEGLNVWSAVHVADLARAYTTLIDSLDSIDPSAFLKNPYFFADDGMDFSWGDAAEQVGRILYKLRKIPSPETRSFDPADYGDVFGPMTEKVAGGNARSRGVRLRELGWEPKEKSVWESLEEDEIPYIIATQS